MIDHTTNSVEGPREWFDTDEAARMMGCSARHAKRELAEVEPSLVRFEHAGRGRPRRMVHFSAHPRLFGAFLRCGAQSSPPAAATDPTEDAPSASADDLATAHLRAQAVLEYRARRYTMPAGQAAAITCAEWLHGRERQVEVVERLGRHGRRLYKDTRVGGFAARTLLAWDAAYEEGGLSALCPRRKGAVGRHESDVPEALLDMIHAAAISTPRANLERGIEYARSHWPAAWPSCSVSTLKRRIRRRDPARFMDALGKSGISRFRAEHTPDCARDYSALSYNALWQLDDITQDFYCHSGLDGLRTVRPFAYAIIRVSTREWISAVVCEARITQDQVRSMIGLALADSRGGIPDEIGFERGTLACDPHLEDLLQSLGVRVHRTSMDGGTVHAGALPDKAKGHFQGKAVVESNIRNVHDRLWAQPGQVGADERSTAQSRLDTMRARSEELAKSGAGPLLLPTMAEGMSAVFAALEAHNRRPHSGLPECVDPATGQRRHCTPAEFAQSKAADPVRVMPQELLPLFFAKGSAVPVTRNGIHVNSGWYGRFDADVAALHGQTVTAFFDRDMPGAIYVQELGRLVDRYVESRYGEDSGEIEKKNRIAAGRQNQYRALMERAVASGASGVIEAMRMTSDPVPGRPVQLAECPALMQRAGRLAAARTTHAEAAEQAAARFDFGEEVRAPRGGGLLARAEELSAHVAALTSHEAPGASDPFASL